MCSPGCFSMVRFSALIRKSGEGDFTKVGESAIEKYSIDPESAMEVLMYDQGEDRMLTTLLIKNGWMLQYAAAAKAVTFCPESFNDFFVQRRRWIGSTMANLLQLMAWGPEIVKNNRSFSLLFFLYCALILASSILGPATVVMITQGGLAFAFNWSVEAGIIIGFFIPAFYVFVCYMFWYDVVTPDTGLTKQKKIGYQIRTVLFLTMIYALWMCAVAVGIAVNIVKDIAENSIPASPDTYFLGSLSLVFILTALMHGEFWSLLHGFLYLCLLPTMYLLLIIFAVANTHDQSWGTRESVGADAAKQDIANLAWIDWIPKMFRWCYGRYKTPKKKDEEEAAAPVVATPKKSEETAAPVTDTSTSTSTSASDANDDNTDTGAGALVAPATATETTDNSDADSGKDSSGGTAPHGILKKSVGFSAARLGAKNDSDDSDDNAESPLAAKIRAAEEEKRRNTVRLYASQRASRRQMWADAVAKDERAMSKVMSDQRELIREHAVPIVPDLARKPSDRGKTVVWADATAGGEFELEDTRGVADSQKKLMALNAAKKKRLAELGQRLRATLDVLPPPPDDVKKQNAEDMAQLSRVAAMLFLLISLAWLTLAFAVGLHAELSALDSNFLGLIFLIAFGALIAAQFLATVYHRWETLLHLVAMVPMKGSKSSFACMDPAQGEYVEIEEEVETGVWAQLTGKERNKSIAFGTGPSLYVPS